MSPGNRTGAVLNHKPRFDDDDGDGDRDRDGAPDIDLYPDAEPV